MVNMAEGLLEPSRSEEGCISYEFLQDPFKPDSFTFLEKWKSQTDLDLHFEKSYFKEFAAKFPKLIVGKASLLSYETSGENVIS